jgi:hypothetical protein
MHYSLGFFLKFSIGILEHKLLLKYLELYKLSLVIVCNKFIIMVLLFTFHHALIPTYFETLK